MQTDDRLHQLLDLPHCLEAPLLQELDIPE